MPDQFHPFLVRVTRSLRRGTPQGFALVVTLSLMILLTIVAVGMLGLAAIELRKSSNTEARSIAMANARMGLMLALGQLQTELGDDRRITADASVFTATKNPAAVGVWNGWSPDLVTKSASSSVPRVDYRVPKSQTGFRSWLVSNPDPEKIRQLAWHSGDPAADAARLFTQQTSGFDLTGEKIPVTPGQKPGTVAWAITQENTKARINIGTDDAKRVALEDRLQSPSRPDLSLSSLLKQPTADWQKRPATVLDLSQAALDPAYGATRESAALAAKNFTVESASLMTNPVKGGLKADLSTGFELSDGDFAKTSWSDTWGEVKNPFRGSTISTYLGQKPLFQPMVNSPQSQVTMNFPPASVNHKFFTNGVPTFDSLRSFYRIYRHLYNSTSGGVTAFERPYSHIAMVDNKVSGRPFGQKSHSSIAPVLDRVNFVFSIYAKADGTLCILMSPLVTVWNPHNVAIETEGLVVYPWIDLAVFWYWNVTSKLQAKTFEWRSSLSRFVGEGYKDSSGLAHGRSSRPYFYLHLTQTGKKVTPGSKSITPAIRLEPGEVRVFCLADPVRTELNRVAPPADRVWRMKAVETATDLSKSLKGGIALSMMNSIDGGNNFTYQLQAGDTVNATPNTPEKRIEFDRERYNYIMSMADGWHIKNPNVELMVEARPALGAFAFLPAEKNLCFYGQVHSGAAFGKGMDYFGYRQYSFEEIREAPAIVGSLLTYHRVAQASTMPLADLMFTTNPRQPFINSYLSGAQFQSGPHYESLLQGGSTLMDLKMETSPDGRNAYYGASHSVSSGRSHLPFFEIPRAPTLSLGGFQHCDIAATAFSCPSQIGNSWASPYIPSAAINKRVSNGPLPGNEAITPMLSVYDSSYLANEALFDSCFLSGAVPRFGSMTTASGTTGIWDNSLLSETRSVTDELTAFFTDPAANPLRNPRMAPWQGSYSLEKLKDRLAGPARCGRIASHLMVEGGFNINSTNEEAWTAVLASLRGVEPASSGMSAQSRFRDVLTALPTKMVENDPWSGFRSLSDSDVQLLAKNIVEEVRTRGPFLSLGEFVNRRISSDRAMNLSGALQSAIDKSGLNKKFGYSTFSPALYPNPENIPNPNTGTNTPGWLSQADVLQGLAPFITPRSDTFIIRSLGEAKAADGRVTATVRLEAVVQRVPDWIDPADDPATPVAELKTTINKTFGRRFHIKSVREIAIDTTGNPI